MMGIFSKLFEKRNLAAPTPEFVRALMGDSVAAGVRVSPESALGYSAVWACVRVLAETVASLPLITYKRQGAVKSRATDFYLYRLLHDAPNPMLTSFEWRELMQCHLLQWGNAFCDVEVDGRGRIMALWPLRPDRMMVVWDGRSARYRYQFPDGRLEWLNENFVFHLRGLSADGVIGYSPLTMARQAVGLGLAAERFGARFFGNDARPGGVLYHPGVLGDEAYNRLLGNWEARHGGLDQSHRVAILEEGMRYEQIGIPPEDAQFLETRKFQIAEVARIFRVPLHLVGELDKATFSNIEHQSLDFVVHVIRPWLVRWEMAIRERLMTEGERAQYFAEFLVDGLLRGDIKSRYEAYSVGRQNGWLSADEIREFENMNPLSGGQGQIYLVPLNMVPAGKLAGRGGEALKRTRLANGREVRGDELDAARARHKLIGHYVELYEDVVGRAVRRETADIGRMARKLLSGRDVAGFHTWLAGFYENEMGFVEGGMSPLLSSYASAIVAMAEAEAGAEGVSVANFVAAYLAQYGDRYKNRHLARLLEAIASAGEGGALAAVEAELAIWQDSEAGRVAREETVRANNAIALAVYVAAGVLWKMWITVGENCPFCEQLNGRRMGVQGAFLGEGERLEAEGKPPLIIGQKIGHAPAHEGCDCMVVISREGA